MHNGTEILCTSNAAMDYFMWFLDEICHEGYAQNYLKEYPKEFQSEYNEFLMNSNFGDGRGDILC